MDVPIEKKKFPNLNLLMIGLGALIVALIYL